MMSGLVLVRPRLMASPGGRSSPARPARSPARPASTSSSTVTATRPRAPAAAAAAARAAPARRRADRHRQRRRGARAAAPSRGRHRDGRDATIAWLRAQRSLEDALAGLRDGASPRPRPGSASRSPGGCPISGARPGASERAAPVDVRAREAGAARRGTVPERPGRPELEQNDVAVLLRSDSARGHRRGREARCSRSSDIFAVTTRPPRLRRRRLPAQAAHVAAAGMPGAELIPPTAELFLGFTSTLKAGLGPPRIANLETLGLARIAAGLLHARHAHAPLAHLREPRGVVPGLRPTPSGCTTMFRPGLQVPVGTLTVPQGPDEVATPAEDRRDYRVPARSATAASIQTASRLARRHVGPDGTRYPAGARCRSAPTSTRSTTRSPGAPNGERIAPRPPPASTSSSSTRRATTSTASGWRWTASSRTATTLAVLAASRGQGINSVLRTTHRQNFLVPPRAHRSFPLAELQT